MNQTKTPFVPVYVLLYIMMVALPGSERSARGIIHVFS